MDSKKILIVDDVEVNRAVVKEIFKNEYSILEAEDGEEALSLIDKFKDDLAAILLDVVMPRLDGLGVIECLKSKGLMERIPVIMITEDSSWESRDKGYTMGVADIIRKPIDPSVTKKRIQNMISLYSHQNEMEKLVKEQTYKLMEQARMLNAINSRVIDTLGTVVEFRSMESGVHVFRIKFYTKILAEYVMKFYPEYGLTQEMVDTITLASSLHDVGKISIPDSVLLKPGRLDDEEFELMKTHSMRGSEVIMAIAPVEGSEFFDCANDIAKYHHERFDGRGYPCRLAGDEIPISAQIVSIADVYDALTHERCYKAAFSPEVAYQMIMDGECGVFNPKLLDCFTKAKKEFEVFLAKEAS